VRFEWDAATNRANIRKHGLNFMDAAEMFHGQFFIRPDTRDGSGEDRWIGVGLRKAGPHL
jgi:hypothetical protein